MQRYTKLNDLNTGKTWLTIGSFDGVHRGHQELINKLVEGAHANDAQAVVLTFHPHPSEVLRKKNDPFYLTGQEDKFELLELLGVDHCVSMKFDLTVASYTAQYFIQLLTESMKLERLIVGNDFALGRGRMGDVSTLSKIGEIRGFTVDVLNHVEFNGQTISSSQIRSLISAGNLENVNQFLGRNYSISGIVSHGDERGKTLGFPTANIAVSQKRLLPKPGVYACNTIIDGVTHNSVANIGYRPTFNLPDPVLQLEVHILDFNSDIYGQYVQVAFVKYIRGEIKFNSVDELKEQISLDVLTAREVLLDV
jgi:riboflavin kinase/FMN adenylyltransferase